MPRLVSIIDHTHVGSVTASLQVLGNVALEKPTNQKAHVLLKGSARASFGFGSRFPGARTPQTKHHK